MNKDSIFLLNPQFNPSDAINCDLLLSINDTSFSYAIVRCNDAQINAIFDVQACENINATLGNCFSSDEYLGLRYNSVKAAFYAENEVLVPDEFYEGQQATYFTNFFKETNTAKRYANEGLAGFNAVFDIEKEISTYFEEDFQKAEKYHQVVPMLVLTGGNGLYLNFTALSVYFLYKKDGKVIFQNQYQVADADEFNYFLLLVKYTLKLTEETPVNVTGIINKGDAKYTVLQRYFNDIGFVDPKGFDIANSILENLPQHYFSALLALNLCA